MLLTLRFWKIHPSSSQNSPLSIPQLSTAFEPHPKEESREFNKQSTQKDVSGGWWLPEDASVDV